MAASAHLGPPLPNAYPMQKLIVEEMVAATSALTREALCEAFKIVFASNAAVTALRNMEALGPLRALLAPIPTPLGFLSDVGSRVSLTNEDRRALNTVSLLLDMLGDNGHTPAQHNASSVQRPSVSLLEMIDDIHRTITTGMACSFPICILHNSVESDTSGIRQLLQVELWCVAQESWCQ